MSERLSWENQLLDLHNQCEYLMSRMDSLSKTALYLRTGKGLGILEEAISHSTTRSSSSYVS